MSDTNNKDTNNKNTNQEEKFVIYAEGQKVKLEK